MVAQHAASRWARERAAAGPVSRAGAADAERRPRGVLLLGLLLSAAGAVSCGGDVQVPLPTFHPAADAIAISGPVVPGVERFDASAKDFLVRWNVPGAALAVARDGKLVLVRGYGFSDFEARQAVQPTSRFRLGSIAKVLTALASLQLADEGKLNLDAPFLDALPGFELPASGDARLREATARQLLHHAGGWDRTKSPDYTQWQVQAAADLEVPPPPSAGQMVRWLLGKPLDFAPGSRFEYSNIGYLVLGRVIEAAGGEPYERRVRDHVLAPMGVLGMSIADGRLEGRQADEVRYYSTLFLRSSFPGEGQVRGPYAWSLEAMDAEGGWIASAVDLTRLGTSLDATRTRSPLSAAAWAQMVSNPQLPSSGGATTFGVGGLSGGWYYGLGLFVSAGGASSWWHGGSSLGTQTSFGRTASGEVYAFLVNTRVEGEPAQDQFTLDLNRLVPDAIAAGGFGSTEDLYPSFPSPDLPAHGP